LASISARAPSPKAVLGRSETSLSARISLTPKWFRLLACFLFGPVTLAAPQLQSFSYAIALSVMASVECLRGLGTPWLLDDYCRHDRDASKNKTYESTRKTPLKNAACFYKGRSPAFSVFHYDSGLNDGRGIVDYMTLVAGCAAPLWMSECTNLSGDDPLRTLVSLWGVLCLGVGGSVEAIVGILLSENRWGDGHHRTVEGSVATLLSMALPCCWLAGEYTSAWVPAILITTLLKASSVQTDSLILPLVGATVLLLCSR